MKTYAQKTKSFIKSHKIVSLIITVVVLLVAYQIFGGGQDKTEVFSVKNGDIVQKVIVNGKTKAVHTVDLGFQSNGIVSKLYTSVGTRVVEGQTLISLDNRELYAQYLKAQANVASEKSRLDELKKGTKAEEVAVAEVAVSNAEVTLGDAQKNLKDKILDIIGNNIDQLFSNPRTANPQFNLTVYDSQTKSDINNSRAQIETIINSWNLENGEQNLPKISAFIDNVAKVVNYQTATPSLSQTTIDGYKTDLSSAKSTIITYRDALTSAKASLSVAQKNLALKKSGSTPEAITSQEANVLQAEANLEDVSAQLSKTTLKSPQRGIVTKQDAKVGEIVTPGKVVISVISDNDLEIETNVSEISIGKVAIGNPVDITFDAFPGEVFEGSVTYIEPAETIVDGVVNYKVTVALSQEYPQIKSGLTSKLEIITGTKKDVLVIPQYALITKNGSSFVLKMSGKDFVEVPVTTGLRGQDGFVEILGGLSAGDTINMVIPVE